VYNKTQGSLHTSCHLDMKLSTSCVSWHRGDLHLLCGRFWGP